MFTPFALLKGPRGEGGVGSPSCHAAALPVEIPLHPSRGRCAVRPGEAPGQGRREGGGYFAGGAA